MTPAEQDFQALVLRWHKQHGRHNLPWRQTHDPYCVLVSELMLQQTQVARVIPKYEAFIARWSTVQQLAQAPLAEVIIAWQGLGYNRRAKFLHQCAQIVAQEYDGVFPPTEAALRQLPGIGPYTAAAVCAFAYNQPVELVETNVRQVMIHHFFNTTDEVTDTMILDVVRRTLPAKAARTWYAALMDYGSFLKAEHGNNTRKVKGYSIQPTFKGSDRQVRGAILRALSNRRGARSQADLERDLAPLPPDKITAQLHALQTESLVRACGRGKWRLG